MISIYATLFFAMKRQETKLKLYGDSSNKGSGFKITILKKQWYEYSMNDLRREFSNKAKEEKKMEPI